MALALNTFLMVRNTVGDRGFGVCSPSELGNSACNPHATYTGGGGELNELGNRQGAVELIRLKIVTGEGRVALDGGGRGRQGAALGGIVAANLRRRARVSP